MKSKFTWIFTLLLAFFIQFAFAQEKTVTGVVNDAQGLPIPGVTVMVQGTTAAGVQTDFDGKFAIQAAPGQNLVFSYVSMKEQVVKVGAASTVTVTMQESSTQLKDVVIEGYRSTARKTSNVAVTTITSETIANRPNASFVQSLQGQIPGLNISTGSGSPGSAQTSVILRGLGSLNGNTEPLYVIDGVPSNLLNFRTINGNDIESVSVLKDAGATSVYGNRGANGVIVVKTKRGAFDSGLKIRYSGVTGFTTMQRENYNLMSGQQLLRLERNKGVGDGAGLTDEQIAAAPNTDWKDYFFRTGITQEHNINFTQGSQNTNSFISLGYFKQDGIVPNTDIQRISVRSNFTGKSSNQRFNYTTNLYAGYSRRNQLESETRSQDDPTFAGNTLQNPLQGSLSSLPYLDPAFYQNGRQLFDDLGSPGFHDTPYFLMDYIKNIYNRYNEVKLLFNGSASYKLTNDLTAGVQGGIDFTENQRVFARLPQSYLAIVSAESAGYGDFPGLETQSTTRDFSFNGNARLNYNKVFGDKHTVDASLMTEYYKADYNGRSFQTSGLQSRTYSPGAGTGYVPFNPATPNLFVRSISATIQKAGLFSYFGMADYDYDTKYGVGVSVRRDASYRFDAENQWGTFWSVTGRWNIDREDFMQNSIFTELKLRGSIGTSGNQNIGGESPYASPNVTRTLYGNANGYANQSGIGITQLGNPDAKWETTSQANIGIDFVLNKRLRGTFDVYRKYTKDLYQEIPVSANNGTYTFLGNSGNMENKGIEALLAYDVIKTNDFTLTVSGNGSYNKNELKNMPNGDQAFGTLQINADDQVAYQYFMVRYAGVNPSNGNSLYYNAAGTLTETPVLADRVATGKSFIPVYQGGFGFQADYKGFYASTQFTFTADVYRLDDDYAGLMDPTDIGSFQKSADLERAWTPENPTTDVPSINATNSASDRALSDRFLHNSSYVRLKFAQIGYNVPATFLEKTFLSNVRLYAQAENIVTWTKWRGFDAESNSVSTFGGYPTPRVFSVGVDVQF